MNSLSLRALRAMVMCAAFVLAASAEASISAPRLVLGSAAIGQTEDALAAGPMPAWSALRTVTIWLQTRDERDVELRLRVEGSDAKPLVPPAIHTLRANDHIATFVVDDLEPGTTYRYEVWIEGKQIKRLYDFLVKTQPLWEWRNDPPAFTAMIGSCLYVNEAVYDRPGKPYGSEYEILTTMAAQKPDLMVWLGDNCYTREVDFYAPGGIRHRYRHTRTLPELQAFLACTQHYATWDDHDYGPNDADKTYSLKDYSLATFGLYWPAPVYGTREAPGVYQRFRWEDVDFFLLDDRYYRMPDEWPDGDDKVMLGEAQMRWLKEGLVSSDAAFKVVACGNQVLNDVGKFETMGRYPTERADLLNWIVSRKIEGVIFISGDRHRSELTRIVPDGGYPLYDFTSSSITAGIANMKPTDAEWELPNRVEGTLLLEHSYGLLKFAGPRKERTVTFVACAKDGTAKWEKLVARAELKAK